MKAIDVPIGSKAVFAGQTLLCKSHERGFTKFLSDSGEVYLSNDKEVFRYSTQLDLF